MSGCAVFLLLEARSWLRPAAPRGPLACALPLPLPCGPSLRCTLCCTHLAAMHNSGPADAHLVRRFGWLCRAAHQDSSAEQVLAGGTVTSPKLALHVSQAEQAFQAELGACKQASKSEQGAKKASAQDAVSSCC